MVAHKIICLCFLAERMYSVRVIKKKNLNPHLILQLGEIIFLNCFHIINLKIKWIVHSQSLMILKSNCMTFEKITARYTVFFVIA